MNEATVAMLMIASWVDVAEAALARSSCILWRVKDEQTQKKSENERQRLWSACTPKSKLV